MPDGSTANRNGNYLEKQIEGFFVKRGVNVCSYREWDGDTPALVKNYPYTSIYGSSARAEFVVALHRRLIRIECRYQNVKGSVDEKFPYLIENCLHSENHPPETVLVIEGDGFRKGAINWVKSKIRDNGTNRVFTVASLKEFPTVFAQLGL